MRKNEIVILETMKVGGGAYLRKGWKKLTRHAFGLGVAFGAGSFVSVCLSMEITAIIMGMACMLCFWANDIKK